jgi:hypothetical protein
MNTGSCSAISWPLFVLALAGSAAIVELALGASAGAMPPTGAALVAVAVPTFLAPLFWPRAAGGPLQPFACALGSLATAGLLALLSWLVMRKPIPVVSLALAGLVALGVLVVAGQCATVIDRVLGRFGASARVSREWALWTIMATLWLSAAAPLWLGPVADLGAGVNPALPTAVLACSPLVHLATAAGYDLLRSQWFYGHSSLGALQVEYPGIATLLLGYGAAGAVLTLLTIPFGRRPKDTALVEPRIAQGERHSC